MKKRCDNKKSIDYERYGGRGISYCEKWIRFEGFYEDMKNGYDKNLTLDRIDNNKHYCKENCRWISKGQQAKNRRNNHYITYKGKTMILSDWARETGIAIRTLSKRITTYGWTIERALNKI